MKQVVGEGGTRTRQSHPAPTIDLWVAKTPSAEESPAFSHAARAAAYARLTFSKCGDSLGARSHVDPGNRCHIVLVTLDAPDPISSESERVKPIRQSNLLSLTIRQDS